MGEQNQTQGGGMSAIGVLGIIFVCCKIFEVEPITTWSWWLVTAPFWGGVVLFLTLLALGALFVVAKALWSSR